MRGAGGMDRRRPEANQFSNRRDRRDRNFDLGGRCG